MLFLIVRPFASGEDVAKVVMLMHRVCDHLCQVKTLHTLYRTKVMSDFNNMDIEELYDLTLQMLDPDLRVLMCNATKHPFFNE